MSSSRASELLIIIIIMESSTSSEEDLDFLCSRGQHCTNQTPRVFFVFVFSLRMLTIFPSMSRKISMVTSCENERAIAMETILKYRQCVKFTIGP